MNLAHLMVIGLLANAAPGDGCAASPLVDARTVDAILHVSSRDPAPAAQVEDAAAATGKPSMASSAVPTAGSSSAAAATTGAKPAAAPAPKKRSNPFPQHGRELSEREMFSYPMGSLGDQSTTFNYGAIAREGMITVPKQLAYRCKKQPTCMPRRFNFNDWVAYGWWGREF